MAKRYCRRYYELNIPNWNKIALVELPHKKY